MLNQLIEFMRLELGISDRAIALAQKSALEPNILPIVLWQYGILNREQLDRVFDWLETV
jgi:hypothetical protein